MDSWTQRMSRRSFLGAAAAGAGTLAIGPLLAGCAGSGGGAAATRNSTLADILPTYLPSSLAPPDIPGVYGSDPGYLSYPTDLIRTVSEVPGAGSTFTAATPLWGTIPAAKGNRYYAAVNKALGASVNVQPADGINYLNTMTKLLAGTALPDWIEVPSWWTRALGFGELVEAKCVDLTPYLSGGNVRKYPNLANVPSNAWQAGIWNGKLYGIPAFSSNISLSGALYYRKDFFDAKGLTEPKTADEFFLLGRDLNDPQAKRWAFDDCWTYLTQPFDLPPGWTADAGGALVYRYELDRYVEGLAFAAKIVKAGYMHPDAVAGNTGNAKKRFASGAVAVYGDGTGAWSEQVTEQDLAGNTAFRMQAMAPFSANGTDKPRCPQGNGASLFSYLNKDLPKAKVEELLRLANYLAAPYGSAEYTLVNYGELGVHHTMAAAGPKLTAAGSKEIALTYQFLATPPSVTARPGYPSWVKAYTAWQGKTAEYAYKPLFFDLNVVEPAAYSGLNDAVEAVVSGVIRGTKTVADYRDAVTTWQQKGGENLRTFYTKVRESSGTGS